MSFFQALRYFVREAMSGLGRGWKSSLLSILTIAVSLFVWGAFLLAGGNLEKALESWRGEARIVVYLNPGTSETHRQMLERWLDETAFVREVRAVTSTEAKRRFQTAFPSLSDLLEGWADSPLPPSLEIAVAPEVRGQELEEWLEELRARPGVDLVDDDRDWLVQLESIASAGQALGTVVGLVLLGAASFTIASVIRLTAFLYQDEIAIMRMVGATEFLIRGPFYFEGMIQGAAGAGLAAIGLYGAYVGLATGSGGGLLQTTLLGSFLSPFEVAFLIAVGCLAGGLGAAFSLKGEVLAEKS